MEGLPQDIKVQTPTSLLFLNQWGLARASDSSREPVLAPLPVFLCSPGRISKHLPGSGES